MSWCDQTVCCRCRFGRLELIDTGSGAMFDEETVELRSRVWPLGGRNIDAFEDREIARASSAAG
jgi:hypothetical protein